MFKRILLFLGTNILVIATISIITSALGLHGYLNAHGIDYQKLALFCLIWGMTGSLISLLLSRFMAKMAMGIVLIDPSHTTSREEKFLLDLVHRLARKANIETMPEVGIYSSPELNAFATGPSKNRSLVAVSSGLLASMREDEIEGVLAHEISHISNGDMVTMTLIQGVVNAFSMFLSRVLAYAISTALSRNEESSSSNQWVYFGLTILFDILFTILGSLLTMAFSRWREFRADAGGARLAGRDKMISALRRLQMNLTLPEDTQAPQLAAFKISHKGSWLEWFSSHPPLEKRIEALSKNTYSN